MTAPNYLDHILNGAMVLDEQCTVLFWNHWLEIQTGIKRGDIVGNSLYDFFPDINKKLIERKLRQVYALNTPAFINAEAEKYLLKIPSKKISGKIYDYMLQNVVISAYDKKERYTLFMIYDQTSLLEARVRLETSTRLLEEQHSLLQNTLDFQANVIFVMDDNKIVNYNNNFLEVFGYDSVERVNSGERDLLSYVSAEKNENLNDIYGSFNNFILDSLNRNRLNKISVADKNTGRETTFLFSVRKMPENSTIIVSMTDITLLQNREKVLQDINLELSRRYEDKNTELKKLNFDLARNRDQLRIAQEVASIGSFEYSCATGSIFLSHGLKIIFDNPDIAALSLPDVLAYLKPEYRKAVSDKVALACREGGDFSAYAEIVSKKGVEKPIGIHCRVFGSMDEGRRLTITMNDLTNIKQLENQIKDREQLVSSLFDVADIGFVITDRSGVIFRVNSAFLSMTGYESDDLIGASLDKLHIESYKSDYGQYERDDKDALSEVTLTHRNGAKLYAYMNVSTFKGQDEDEYRVLALTDITDRINLLSEQKEQEQLLIQQSKMAAMGEMIGVIGHQWKQPLNSMSLILDNIKSDVEDDMLDMEMLNIGIDRCLEQIHFMSETIDDFRSFFSHETVVSAFDLKSTVNNTVRLLSPLFERHGTKIDIVSELDKNVYVTGIANEFKHTLMNLLSNSKDAISSRILNDTRFKGRITIFMSVEDSSVFITVCDNGGGIPEKVLSHIFKPYFTTKGDKGTGIGMYLAQIIISKKMNGSITAENKGEGACIRITLPVS